jgi:hypothetical protein
MSRSTTAGSASARLRRAWPAALLLALLPLTACGPVHHVVVHHVHHVVVHHCHRTITGRTVC